MKHVVQGFLLGLAYIAPIGTQNLYVIRCALTRRLTSAAKVALIVAIVDISLALACFYGMSEAIDRVPYAAGVLAMGGAAFLLYMGFKLLRQEHHPMGEAQGPVGASEGGWSVLKTACAITWLNPQAIVDGSVLFGGGLKQAWGEARDICCCSASPLPRWRGS